MDEFNRGAAEEDRREFLTKFGKAAIVAPPVITVLLSTSMSSPAIARSTGGPKGNNGVGNGDDPQPPGNPPVNDGLGSGPGNPGNNGNGPGGNAHANNGNGPQGNAHSDIKINHGHNH